MNGWQMARKRYAPVNKLPGHYIRDLLPEPVAIRFRELNVTEGRGSNWQTGNLYGWDSHCSDEPCPIVYSEGWRTLTSERFEWK